VDFWAVTQILGLSTPFIWLEDYRRANEGGPDQLDGAAKKSEAAALAGVDAEPRYFVGALLSYCGQKDAAVRLLRSAIEQNYCAYTALQSDPLLVKLRGTPEFSGLLSAAKDCQNRFLAQRDQIPH